MSSNYRDVGEAHLHLYQGIPEDLDHKTREELIGMLQGIRAGAKDDYDTYAAFMGWSSIADMEEDEAEQERQPVAPRQPNKRYSIRARMYWMEQKGIKPDEDYRFVAEVERETDAAMLVRWCDVLVWLPKRLIIDKHEVEMEDATTYKI